MGGGGAMSCAALEKILEAVEVRGRAFSGGC